MQKKPECPWYITSILCSKISSKIFIFFMKVFNIKVISGAWTIVSMFPIGVKLTPRCHTIPSVSHLPLGVTLSPRCHAYPSVSHLPLGVTLTPRCHTYPSVSHYPLGVTLTPRCHTYPSIEACNMLSLHKAISSSCDSRCCFPWHKGLLHVGFMEDSSTSITDSSKVSDSPILCNTSATWEWYKPGENTQGLPEGDHTWVSWGDHTEASWGENMGGASGNLCRPGQASKVVFEYSQSKRGETAILKLRLE